MLSMLGGQGMGSAGMGAGASPMMPGGGAGAGAGGGLTPQMMAYLMQMQGNQGGGGGQVTAAPGPLQAPATGTPMAGYLGSGGNPGAMQARPAMPVGQPPGMNGQGGAAAPAAGGGAMSPQMLQMLQMMKGQQSGVPAGGTPISGMPNTGGAGSILPANLQALLNSGSYGATGMQMNPAMNTAANGMMVGGV